LGERAWSPKNVRLCQNCVSSLIRLGVAEDMEISWGSRAFWHSPYFVDTI
jgi:hypothetical protein